MLEHHHPLEPYLKGSDLSYFQNVSWEKVDQKCSEVLGQACYGIPSIRVGLCWTMEFLGLSRHRDHVLVPKFLGRCIGNTLNRFALPVESPTPATRLVLVVDQYGLRQDVKSIRQECEIRKCVYVEDSPYGLGAAETLGPGSLARFVGLTKILPVVQGGMMICENPELIKWVKKKRDETSRWSWLVWGSMAFLRHQRMSSSHSAIAEAAYELYVEARGGNRFLRGNIMSALKKVDSLGAEEKRRWQLLEARLGSRILMPDFRKLGYVAPFLANGQSEMIEPLFAKEGFDGTSYHIEMNRNLFSPRYEKVFLIPINPRIKMKFFEKLVTSLEQTSLEDKSGMKSTQ